MQPIHVLMIDDDEDFSLLSQRMLQRNDSPIKLDWCGSFAEGLRAVQNDNYDAYIIDYKLDENTGLDILKHARELGIAAPFIMISGQGGHEIDKQVLSAGAAEYIDKTVVRDPRALRRIVEIAIERAAQTEQVVSDQAFFRDIVENIPQAIVVTDHQDRIIYANPSAARLFGCDTDDLKDCRLDACFHSINGDLQTAEDVPVEAMLPSDTPVEIRRHDSQTGCRHYVLQPTHRRHAAIADRDRYIEQLTTLRQLDDELSQITSAQLVFDLAIDGALRLSGANNGFIALRDGDAIKIVRMIGPASTMQTGDDISAFAHIVQVLRNAEAYLFEEISPAAGYLTVNTNSTAQILLPIKSHEDVLGIINLETTRPEGFDPDILDFIRLIGVRIGIAVENAQLYQVTQARIDEVEELYEQVSKLEQLKSDMIRMAAHDLRQPLNTITMGTNYIKRVADQPGKVIETLDRLSESIQRMKTITEDILSLEKIEKMNGDPDELVDLREIVEAAYRENAQTAEEKHQTFLLEVDLGTYQVLAYRVQLHEAVINLVGNAIKYTPKGGNIIVALEVKDGEAVFQVADTGYGIPAEQQHKLFEPFFRAKSEETESIEGTGLGLHLVHKMIERFKGKMIFESVYGEGSIFGFRLPLVDAPV